MVKISVDEKTGLNYREDTLDLFVIREQSTYKKLMKYVKGKRVLDIGGNIGAFAYTALENGAEKVDSFEPDASNIKMYKRQGLDSTLYEYAVTDRDGKAKFYLNSGKNKGMHTLRETRGREFVEVKTISFEKVLKKTKPQILKIDIEGGEYGLDFDLIPDTVKVIAVEIHLTSADQRSEGKKLLKYLKERYEELTDSKITEKNWTTLFIGKLKR